MAILDCESSDSTYTSVERLFDLSRGQIDRIFDELDQNEFRDPNWWQHAEGDELIARRFQTVVGIREFEGICWFHFTRVPVNERFEIGILPVDQRLDEIWSLLGSLLPRKFGPAAWEEFRDSMQDSPHHYADLYRLKTASKRMSGPFAMLLRSIAFERGRHDTHYLRTPETIEDICIVFKETHGFDLQRAFIRQTKPCIVKFLHREHKLYALEGALHYLYLSRKRGGTKGMMPGCFDAAGSPIPPADILKVEFIPRAPRGG